MIDLEANPDHQRAIAFLRERVAQLAAGRPATFEDLVEAEKALTAADLAWPLWTAISCLAQGWVHEEAPLYASGHLIPGLFDFDDEAPVDYLGDCRFHVEELAYLAHRTGLAATGDAALVMAWKGAAALRERSRRSARC